MAWQYAKTVTIYNATLMHNTNFDNAETHHLYFPKNIDSWCKYQKDILNGEKTYKDHVNLPVAI